MDAPFGKFVVSFFSTISYLDYSTKDRLTTSKRAWKIAGNSATRGCRDPFWETERGSLAVSGNFIDGKILKSYNEGNNGSRKREAV